LGISQRAVLDLAARDVLKRGASRGGYLLGSIQSYCEHLRKLAQGMGGEAAIAEAVKQRAKLSKAQAELAQAKAERMKGEVVPVADVQQEWTGRLRALRARILSVGDKLRHLPAKDHVKVMTELRAALTEAAEGED
jgi:phage terminase Nu1 subunit (DNA packaging protein)